MTGPVRFWPIQAIAAGLGLLVCAPGQAQVALNSAGGPLRIINSDMAVLEAQDVRKDLNCTVSPMKPALGFDLRFHAGFNITIPLKELEGGESMLTVLFRVTADSRKDDPSYFVEHVKVPPLDEDAKGEVSLDGTFDLGEGNYHIDWLMRDRSEHVCSFYWDADASLPSRDKQIELTLAPGTAENVQLEQFNEEPPVHRAQTPAPLNVKVLVNFAPQNFDSPALRPADTVALVSILRRIAREPQFTKFSLVAFNIQEQRVLYRQQSTDQIDFPALGEALQSMKLGTVDLKRLAQKHGDTEFLTDLITQEMKSDDHPDALIFAGPKIMLDESVPQDTLKPFADDVDYPVFYMNYNLNPQAVPWKDSISRAVKVFRGTEYTITRPRDLWFSFSDLVSRIVKSKHGRGASQAPVQ